MKEIDPIVAALADRLWRSPEVPPALPGQEDQLLQALKLNRQRSPAPDYQKPGMMLGPEWLGLNFPLADAISPAGAHLAQAFLGDQGVGQFLPGVGDAMDASAALGLAGDAIGSGLEGDWSGMGNNASWAAVAAMGALPGVDAPPGIRAYHGSPHDFDKFDLSKIGTGEGAQAYGHGLYFAENEGVAKSYRDALASPSAASPDMDTAKYWLDAAGGDRERAVQMIKDYTNYDADGMWRASPEMRASVDRTIGLINNPPGKMYEVNINAKPEDFLDWDKPLNEQGEKVMAALGHMGVDLSRWGHKTGGDFAQYGLGNTAASDLMAHDIRGIRYLDQASRAPGEGTRNYVVFDDKIIDIVRKYGIAGLLALPALGMFGGESEASQ